MRISLDSLLVLDSIDRNGSFASAAEELNRVPSAVTYTINQLELDLGIPIFDRSGYRAKLTPAGQDLLKGGRPLLEQAQALEKKIKISAGLITPNFSISYDDALGFNAIKRVLEVFFEAYPGLSIDLNAEILNGCKDALLSGSADLVVGCFSEVPTEALYRYKSFGQIDFVFAISPHHPLAQVKTPLTHKEIAAHRIVIVPDTARNIPKASSGYAPDRQYISVSSMESKVKAQVAGLGVGFVPLALAKPYLEEGLLVQKKVDRPKSGGHCYLAWREDKATPLLEDLKNLFLKHRKDVFS